MSHTLLACEKLYAGEETAPVENEKVDNTAAKLAAGAAAAIRGQSFGQESFYGISPLSDRLDALTGRNLDLITSLLAPERARADGKPVNPLALEYVNQLMPESPVWAFQLLADRAAKDAWATESLGRKMPKRVLDILSVTIEEAYDYRLPRDSAGNVTDPAMATGLSDCYLLDRHNIAMLGASQQASLVRYVERSLRSLDREQVAVEAPKALHTYDAAMALLQEIGFRPTFTERAGEIKGRIGFLELKKIHLKFLQHLRSPNLRDVCPDVGTRAPAP